MFSDVIYPHRLGLYHILRHKLGSYILYIGPISILYIYIYSLREGAVFIYDQIQLTARYYSTYEHLKELVMVPYIPHQGKPRDILRKRYFEDRANGMEVITINLSGSNEDESSGKK